MAEIDWELIIIELRRKLSSGEVMIILKNKEVLDIDLKHLSDRGDGTFEVSYLQDDEKLVQGIFGAKTIVPYSEILRILWVK